MKLTLDSFGVLECYAIIASMLYMHAIVFYLDQLFGIKDEIPKVLTYFCLYMFSGVYTYFTLFYLPIPVSSMLAFPIFFWIMRIFMQGSCPQHVFASGNFIFHIICLRGIALSSLSLILQKNFYWLVQRSHYYTIAMILGFVAAFFYLKIVFPRLYPLADVKAVTQRSAYLNMILVYQSVLNLLLVLGSTMYFLPLHLWFSLYHLIAYALIAIIFYILFHFCTNSSRLEQYKLGYFLYEMQIKKQMNAYIAQTQFVDQARKFKHDWIGLRNTLLLGVLQSHNMPINKLLDQMDTAIQELSESYIEYSNNPLIQAILLHIQRTCQNYGIKFNASVIVPAAISIEELDLCRIFTNIANNALEATEKLPNNITRFISLTSSITPVWWSVVCKNTFIGEDIGTYGLCRTSKHNSYEHGFGINNICEIVESYSGFVMIESQTNIFSIKIHFPI